MRKLICLILCIIFLCCACMPQSALTKTDSLPTNVVVSNNPTPPKPSQENALQPDLTRSGYISEEPKILGGSDLTEQDIKKLGANLELMDWESLAKVLSNFGVELDAACDIRKCDLTHFSSDNYEVKVRQPVFYETTGIACISVSSICQNDGMEYVITFTQNQNNNYSPCSIITLHNDFYCKTPYYDFEEIGGRLWLIWEGGLGHGTGFYCTGEKLV